MELSRATLTEERSARLIGLKRNMGRVVEGHRVDTAAAAAEMGRRQAGRYIESEHFVHNCSLRARRSRRSRRNRLCYLGPGLGLGLGLGRLD